MYRAVLISLLLHLVVLILSDPLWPTLGANSSGSGQVTSMVLRMAATSQTGVNAGTRQALSDRHVSRTEGQVSIVPTRVPAPLVLPKFPPSTVALHASTKTAGQNIPPEDAAAIPSISSEGERTYRLNLAREARKFKALPPVAGEWVVLIAVSMLSSPCPEVSLRHSSGFEEIDRQVLAMMAQAVKMAEIPPGLQGRRFQIVVPVEYQRTD